MHECQDVNKAGQLKLLKSPLLSYQDERRFNFEQEMSLLAKANDSNIMVDIIKRQRGSLEQELVNYTYQAGEREILTLHKGCAKKPGIRKNLMVGRGMDCSPSRVITKFRIPGFFPTPSRSDLD